MSSSQPRTTLAFIGGFQPSSEALPYGSAHAAHAISEAIARVGGYEALHVYEDQLRAPDVRLPTSPPAKLSDKTMLRGTSHRYQAIYVANGGQLSSAPYLLRPEHDWAPVICSVGTAHSNGQWSNFLLALATGAVYPQDGFIFKSRAALALVRHVWAQWSERFGFAGFPEHSTVIPNGVDVQRNCRSEQLRRDTRDRLRIDDGDVVFLSFSRISPGTKGDQQALVARWRDVVARVPNALLVLAGALVDRGFTEDLRRLARAAGVAGRVLIVENPFDLMNDARSRLMSAADVFVHLSTGVEETSSQVVVEAMAHALPVIATAWAGLPDLVTAGETGFLIETRALPISPFIAPTLFGLDAMTHALAASRVVSCDWNAVVDATVALAQPALRGKMSAAARAFTERHTLDDAARAYVAFFAATSRAAEAAWTGAPACRPLVDLDQVVTSQASRSLRADERVRLADPSRVPLLLAGVHAENNARVERVLAAFEQQPELTLGELAVRAGDARAHGANVSHELAVAGRLFTRMLNHGVLELAP